MENCGSVRELREPNNLVIKCFVAKHVLLLRFKVRRIPLIISWEVYLLLLQLSFLVDTHTFRFKSANQSEII